MKGQPSVFVMGTFNESLYQDFVCQDEAELYSKLQSTYDELVARKVTRVVYPKDSDSSKSRIRFKSRVCQQALLHRALYLFEGSLIALSAKNVYALALCVRGHYEGTAALGYLHKRIMSYIEGSITINDLDRDVYAHVLGSRDKKMAVADAPDPKTIMSQLDYADKVVYARLFHSQGNLKTVLRDGYEFLSEFAHPNFHSYSVAIHVDKRTDSFIFRYDHPLREEEFGLIGWLSISNPIFVELFDSVSQCIEKVQ